MDFNIPTEIAAKLEELDAFIASEIKPLEAQDDNIRFFDHRRENARTDWDAGGLPTREWEDLLGEMRRRADAAGHYRYALPEAYGGTGAGNLAMAIVREHLAAKGLGLHNDLQGENSIVGNLPIALAIIDFGTPEQIDQLLEGEITGSAKFGFGLTEPEHGSDATWMETVGRPESRDGAPGWVLNGEKMWTTGFNMAGYVIVFARTGGEAGQATGITAFIVPTRAPGIEATEYLWTFNMPTDHPRVAVRDVWVPDGAWLGDFDNGLAVAQHFVHENRIRQAASSVGAAQYCIDEAAAYARERKPFGKPLATNQGIQFPLVDLQAEAEMLRALIHKTAWHMDQMSKVEVARQLSDKVAICNYRANRLVCRAADTAMQVHGGLGYSRYKPFEHIYRHHRRYRITEGADEIQMRRVAGHMFGFLSK